MQCSVQQPPDIDVICIKNRDSLSETDLGKSCKKAPCGNVRYLISILAFFAFFNSMTTRACINVAIVAMVNSTQSHSVNETSEGCPRQNDPNTSVSYPEVGEFDWGPDMQSQVLSVFYYGYIISQLPGGYLAERYGSRFIVAWILISSGILCAATPFLARLDVRALIASRFIMGFCQGPIYPSVQALWGLWAPPLERTRLMAFAFGGATVGDLTGLALTGVLCSYGILGGWPLPFFVFGGSCFVFFIIWIVLYDDPMHQRFVSEAERQYITTEIYGSKGRPKFSSPPWRSILTNRVFYGLLLYITLSGISYYIIFICGPTYMKQILNFDIAKNGVLNAAPYLSNFLSSLIAGPTADFIINRKWMSVTATRKTFTLIGGIVGAGFIVAMGFTDCDPTLPIVFLITAWGIGSLTTAGPGISCLDISPQHAGTLMGFLNMFSNIGGFLSPVLVQQLTEGKANRFKWQKVFFMTAGFSCAAAVSYAALGSSDQQGWEVINEHKVNNAQTPEDKERQPLLKEADRQSS